MDHGFSLDGVLGPDWLYTVPYPWAPLALALTALYVDLRWPRKRRDDARRE